MRALAAAAAVWAWGAGPAGAAIVTSDLTTQSAAAAAAALLGPGVTLGAVSYTGALPAAGTFTGGAAAIGLAQGLVLGTGRIADVAGPNTGPMDASTQFGLPGDPVLDALAQATTWDAAVLDVDFVPCASQVTLQFVFASEEYNEFVGQYNDAFTIEVNGANVALVPGTATPVSVNTVNAASNAMSYVDNDGPGPRDTQLDGLTTVFTALVAVSAGATNHLRVAIADARDDAIDSAVFLGAGSLRCTGLPSLSAAAAATPSSVCPGQDVTVTLTVTNTGGVDLAMVRPGPLSFGGTGAASAAGGPWPASAAIPAGQGATFAYTVTALAAGDVIVTGSATADFSGSAISSPPASATVSITALVGALSASLLSPSVVSTGQTVTVTLTASNTGGGAVTGPAPWLAAAPAGRVTPLTGPSPAPPASLAPGAAASFTWTFAAASAGAVAWNGGVGGMVCPATPVSASAFAGTVIQAGASLAASLSAFPSPRNTGQTFLVTMTVTNTGQAGLNGLGVAPFRFAPAGLAVQTAGPSPAMPPSLAGGASAVFTWTFTGMSPGTVVISTTPSGTDANSGALVRTLASSNGEVIQAPAALSVTGWALPITVPCAGEPFLLVVTVSNTGQATATGVAVADPVGAGGGLAAVLPGPNPPGPVTLAGGEARTFTWTGTGAAPGTVLFTATAAGTDANTLAPVSSGPSPAGSVTVSATPGALDAAVAVAPALVSAGQWVTVTLTATNTGGSDLQGVSAVLSGPPGAGVVTAGPVPGAAAVLPVGAARTFTWSYSLAGAGVVALSATVTATACGTTPVSAVAGAAVTAVAPAALSATLAASATVLVAGQWVTVTVYVTNTGGASATAVVPSLLRSGAPATLLAGPVPASATALGPGGTRAFVWSWSAAGAGTLVFTAGAAARDANSGVTVAAAPPPPVTILVLGPAALTVASFTLSPGPEAHEGDFVTALFTVRNAGGSDALLTAVSVSEAESAPGVFSPASAFLPVVPAVVPAGGTRVFSWTYTAGGCGSVLVGAGLTAQDAATGATLPVLQAGAPLETVFGLPVALSLSATPASAVAGSAVTLVAEVRDACGRGIPDALVAFTVVAAEGSLAPTQATTDGAGKARVRWTLDVDPATNRVRADIPGMPLSATATIAAGPNPLAVDAPGTAALSANVFAPGAGESVVARVYPRPGRTFEVRVYTASGRLVRILDERTPFGRSQFLVTWDGRDDRRALVARGVYLIRVSGGADAVLKMVVR